MSYRIIIKYVGTQLCPDCNAALNELQYKERCYEYRKNNRII